VRRSELVVDVDAGYELLEGDGCFISEFWELWFESALGQQTTDSIVGGDNFRARFTFHWFNVDCAAVVVVED
jgi:hypothetical protein